jgi:hypothetical protein
MSGTGCNTPAPLGTGAGSGGLLPLGVRAFYAPKRAMRAPASGARDASWIQLYLLLDHSEHKCPLPPRRRPGQFYVRSTIRAGIDRPKHNSMVVSCGTDLDLCLINSIDACRTLLYHCEINCFTCRPRRPAFKNNFYKRLAKSSQIAAIDRPYKFKKKPRKLSIVRNVQDLRLIKGFVQPGCILGGLRFRSTAIRFFKSVWYF